MENFQRENTFPPYTERTFLDAESLFLVNCPTWTQTHRPLTVGVDGPHVSPADPHQAVQRSSFAVQTGAVILDLTATLQHDLRTQREILHQHPPVVHHLALTLTTDHPT